MDFRGGVAIVPTVVSQKSCRAGRGMTKFRRRKEDRFLNYRGRDPLGKNFACIVEVAITYHDEGKAEIVSVGSFKHYTDEERVPC
jgi:hypothetical protein